MRRCSVVMVLAAWSLRAGALEITNVQHDPTAFDPAKGERAKIHFHISEPARVRVRIFDGRNLQVRELSRARPLPAADHTITWDGKDSRGRRVPPEAYLYTIEARSGAGDLVEWDISDHTSGDPAEPQHVEWSPEQGKLTYVVSRPARVNIRIGIQNHGPLLRTLVDWVPRGPGAHAEPWDGKDMSGVLDVARDPQLAISATGFSLGDNTILVLPEPREVKLIEDLPPPRFERQRKKTFAREMYAHDQQAIDERRDFALKLALPAGTKVGADGIPLVHGPIELRLEVPPSDGMRALNERFETVFFVDQQFAFESEVGFLPMTWQWNPDGISEGIHYLTANLRGYDGHFGMTTIRVRIQR